MGEAKLRPEKLGELTPEILQAFLFDYGRDKKAGHIASVSMTVRVSLRFCLHCGYLERDLTPALPSFVQHKHSRLPAAISEEDARKALGGIDRATTIGKRDYAILRMLYTYGVRGGHVSLLRLDDIEWSAAQIRFPSVKRGKRVVVPITEDLPELLGPKIIVIGFRGIVCISLNALKLPILKRVITWSPPTVRCMF